MYTYALLPILLSELMLNAQAKRTEAELKQESQSNGTVKQLVSKKSDSIGKEGLWGVEADFIVSHGCAFSFEALKDIERYPERIKAVKKVEAIEKTSDTLLTKYTEGGWGFESTSTILFEFDPLNTPSKITFQTVGKEDPPSWSQIQLFEVDHKQFCNVHIRIFADMSWAPQFMLSWVSSMAADELVSSYRGIIDNAALDSALQNQ